jgi:hypothetical protein
MTYPCSAYDKVSGIVYFARMLSKIRLNTAGKLPSDYHKNLGIGFDGRCCRFLCVTYQAVQERVLQGGTDEEILQWCFDHERKPNDEEILIWNAFMMKRGWRDDNTEDLNKYKSESGFANCTEIQTLFDYYEYDEKRAK